MKGVKYIYKEVRNEPTYQNLFKIINWCVKVIVAKLFRWDIDSLSLEPIVYNGRNWTELWTLVRLKAWFGVNKNMENVVNMNRKSKIVYQKNLDKIKLKQEHEKNNK